MDHAIHIGADLQNLRVDIDLAVPSRGARDDISFKIDGKNILHRDLVETDAMRLHEEQIWIVGQPKRDVSACKIILTLSHQHLAGYD